MGPRHRTHAGQAGGGVKAVRGLLYGLAFASPIWAALFCVWLRVRR